jgi:hypothetical protein
MGTLQLTRNSVNPETADQANADAAAWLRRDALRENGETIAILGNRLAAFAMLGDDLAAIATLGQLRDVLLDGVDTVQQIAPGGAQ